MPVADSFPANHEWAVQWADQAVALLQALLEFEESGRLPSSGAARDVFESGDIEDIVGDHVRQVLFEPHEAFQVAVAQANDLLLKKEDIVAMRRLSRLLANEAAHGWWEQQVPLQCSASGYFEGESTLMGLGVLVQEANCPNRLQLPDAAHAERLKGLLLKDNQVCNAFRVLVVPVLLTAEQAAGMDAWAINYLRSQLELWASGHLQGHPDSDTTRQWLTDAGVAESVDDSTMTALRGDQCMCQLALVMHSSSDPTDTEPQEISDVSGPLQAMLFPRAQAQLVLDYLNTEQENIAQALVERHYSDAASVRALHEAQSRCRAEVDALEANYGDCLHHAGGGFGGAEAASAGRQLNQFYAEFLMQQGAGGGCVVVASCVVDDCAMASQRAQRYARFSRQVFQVAQKFNVDVDELDARVELDDEAQEMAVFLRPMSLDAVLPERATWPLLDAEAAPEFLGSLRAALGDIGLTIGA